jgi:hypothetical protein
MGARPYTCLSMWVWTVCGGGGWFAEPKHSFSPLPTARPADVDEECGLSFNVFFLSLREQTCDDTRADTLGVCAGAADYIVDVEKGCRV